MTVDGVSQVGAEGVRRLRASLNEVGVAISDHLPSPMNQFLVASITSNIEHLTRDADFIDRFERLQGREDAYVQALDAKVAQTRAVIVWSGGKLSQNYVNRLRAAYAALDPGMRVDADRNQDVPRTIAGDALPDHLAAQGLDQERIHPEAVREVRRLLAGFVGDRITVHVPPDTALIRPPAELRFPEGAVAYRATAQPKSVTFPGAHAAPTYLVLVTIGHGGRGGTTFFPPAGGLVPQVIAQGLPAARQAALCVPLQCFPQDGVREWQAVRGWSPNITAVSIPTLDESHDAEMSAWVEENLHDTVQNWFYTL
ncbi:hypothetical protein IOD16_02000 [Saccharothrix sp. 6-C]|uniref:hypothetical protein n=1 Tax=Saccharothrix sp. 6-C TaxID=2781735 RepID=UPI00191718AF|nr:hypothetical protein [Saccharothrix sp. 6-C]QQQ77348.1 hypothetical protein IOD16_02000 [Saccharothrix sp. 6-C]